MDDAGLFQARNLTAVRETLLAGGDGQSRAFQSRGRHVPERIRAREAENARAAE